MKRLLLGCAVLLAGTALVQATEAPKVIVTPVTTTNATVTGQPIVVPDKPDVAVSEAVFPSGARLPVHKHPYPHFAYVLEGVLDVTNVETGEAFQIKKGEFLAEMNNTWHYGINNSKEPVKLLIIDELPHGVTSNVVLKDTK